MILTDFMCYYIILVSGSVCWEIKLEGRVECSAAIVGDFCQVIHFIVVTLLSDMQFHMGKSLTGSYVLLDQVVVGCYEGNIYFLDFSSGRICWTFRTYGEV